MKLTKNQVLDLLKSEHVMAVNGIYRVTVGEGEDDRPTLTYGVPMAYEFEILMSSDDLDKATAWKVHYNDADGRSRLSCVLNGHLQQVCTLLFAPRTQWELEMHVCKYAPSEETKKLDNMLAMHAQPQRKMRIALIMTRSADYKEPAIKKMVSELEETHDAKVYCTWPGDKGIRGRGFDRYRALTEAAQADTDWWREMQYCFIRSGALEKVNDVTELTI